MRWWHIGYLSSFSEMLTEATLQLATKARGWELPGHGRVDVGQCSTAQDLTPGAPSGTWTTELEGCQQSLDTGEYFWHFPGGNAMCPTCNVGLQPFLFGSWSRASNKREQKKTENSSQPLKSVSEVCLKGKAQTLHQDASPVWHFLLPSPSLSKTCWLLAETPHFYSSDVYKKG